MKNLLILLIAFILFVLFAPIIFTVNTLNKSNKARYIEVSAIGIDQAGGAILYEKENFTISSYTYYLCRFKNKNCWFMKIIDKIFGKNHCKNSYYWEIKKDKQDLKELLG